MKQVICFLGIVGLLCACKKDNSNNNISVSNDLTGHYSGTFSRTGMDTVTVSINFKDDHTYEGSSGANNYPAICSGRYEQNGKSLSVTDTCTWTANFDWTLIFTGDYFIDFTSDNTIRIWRTTRLITDEYLLTRVSR